MDTGSARLLGGMPPSQDGGARQPTNEAPWRAHKRLFLVFVALECVLGGVLAVVAITHTTQHPRLSEPVRAVARSQPPTAVAGSQVAPAQAPTTAAPGPSSLTTTPTSSPAATPPTASGNPASNPSSGSTGYMNGTQNYVVGQTGTLWDPDKMVPLATIAIGAPQFSTSDSSGDTPQYGYFATFTVTVTNIAPASLTDTITPSDGDYYVLANGSGYGFGQANVGNTAKAEGANSLGTSLEGGSLTPGQSTSGTVTVDVPSQHGSLVYAPSGTALGTWSY